MNYDQQITNLVEALKADKSLSQPFKNYAVSDLLRVQAVVRMAKQNTNLEPPADFRSPDESACICPTGAFDINCPEHGTVL